MSEEEARQRESLRRAEEEFEELRARVVCRVAEEKRKRPDYVGNVVVGATLYFLVIVIVIYLVS